MPKCKTCTYRDTTAIKVNSRGLGLALKALKKLSNEEYERVSFEIDQYAKKKIGAITCLKNQTKSA